MRRSAHDAQRADRTLSSMVVIDPKKNKSAPLSVSRNL
jgi:hypothetical protein